MKTIGNTSACALCGAELDVPDGLRSRTTIEGVSGKPNERVIYLRGKEIHRCVLRHDTRAT
jgi:hypothetical protein